MIYLGIDIGGTKCAVILGSYEVKDSNQEIVIVQKKVFDTKKVGDPYVMIGLFTHL